MATNQRDLRLLATVAGLRGSGTERTAEAASRLRRRNVSPSVVFNIPTNEPCVSPQAQTARGVGLHHLQAGSTRLAGVIVGQDDRVRALVWQPKSGVWVIAIVSELEDRAGRKRFYVTREGRYTNPATAWEVINSVRIGRRMLTDVECRLRAEQFCRDSGGIWRVMGGFFDRSFSARPPRALRGHTGEMTQPFCVPLDLSRSVPVFAVTNGRSQLSAIVCMTSRGLVGYLCTPFAYNGSKRYFVVGALQFRDHRSATAELCRVAGRDKGSDLHLPDRASDVVRLITAEIWFARRENPYGAPIAQPSWLLTEPAPAAAALPASATVVVVPE